MVAHTRHAVARTVLSQQAHVALVRAQAKQLSPGLTPRLRLHRSLPRARKRHGAVSYMYATGGRLLLSSLLTACCDVYYSAVTPQLGDTEWADG